MNSPFDGPGEFSVKYLSCLEVTAGLHLKYLARDGGRAEIYISPSPCWMWLAFLFVRLFFSQSQINLKPAVG